MLVGNDVRRDPRVQKEARTLADAGYSVGVIGLSYSKAEDWRTEPGGYRVKVVTPTGPIKQQVKTTLSSLAPDAYDVLTRRYRRLRGIPERPVAAPAHAPSAPEDERARQTAVMRTSLTASMRTHGTRSVAHANAAIRTLPRVVHAHDLDTLQAAAWVARSTGAALVFDSHEIWWKQHADGHAPDEWVAFFRDLERELFPRCDRVITVCDSIADFFVEQHHVRRPEVIRNAIEVPQGGFRKADELHPTTAPIEALFHGGFSFDRGLEELLAAAPALEGARLVLRGFGSLEPQLRAIVERDGLEDKVRFDNPVPMDQVVDAASRSDVGIIPYKPVCLNNRYSTPNKMFEYLSAGVAIAASNLPELRRVITEEDVGALFDPDAPESIADAINTLARDPDRVYEMRRRAVQAAAERHNWSVEAPKLLDVYKELLPRRWTKAVRRVALGS